MQEESDRLQKGKSLFNMDEKIFGKTLLHKHGVRKKKITELVEDLEKIINRLEPENTSLVKNNEERQPFSP